MKPKTLTLLILSAIVMASVACGSSEEGLHQKQKELIQEQKNVMLCEDALKRRADALRVALSAISRIQANIAEDQVKQSDTDIDKYCK